MIIKKNDFFNLICNYLDVEYPLFEYDIKAVKNDIYNYDDFFDQAINALIH